MPKLIGMENFNTLAKYADSIAKKRIRNEPIYPAILIGDHLASVPECKKKIKEQNHKKRRRYPINLNQYETALIGNVIHLLTDYHQNQINETLASQIWKEMFYHGSQKNFIIFLKCILACVQNNWDEYIVRKSDDCYAQRTGTPHRTGQFKARIKDWLGRYKQNKKSTWQRVLNELIEIQLESDEISLNTFT